MKNFVAIGNAVTVIAAADFLSGAGVLVGSLFGVAGHDALTGADLVINLGGIYDLPKTTGQAWTAGQLLYWDAAGAKITTTASTNKIIGVAARIEASGNTTGRAILNGCAVN